MDSENLTAGVDCIGTSRNFGIEAKAIEGEVVEANYRAARRRLTKKAVSLLVQYG